MTKSLNHECGTVCRFKCIGKQGLLCIAIWGIICIDIWGIFSIISSGGIANAILITLYRKANSTSEDILYLSNLLGIDSSSTYETPGTNEYKVALVIDPSHEYHWYRQNPDWSWSHKPGHTEVINTDASGNVIYCPETCNRNYGGVNYSVFCGYYMISYYSSATLTNQ